MALSLWISQYRDTYVVVWCSLLWNCIFALCLVLLLLILCLLKQY